MEKLSRTAWLWIAIKMFGQPLGIGGRPTESAVMNLSPKMRSDGFVQGEIVLLIRISMNLSRQPNGLGIRKRIVACLNSQGAPGQSADIVIKNSRCFIQRHRFCFPCCVPSKTRHLGKRFAGWVQAKPVIDIHRVNDPFFNRCPFHLDEGLGYVTNKLVAQFRIRFGDNT